MDPEGLTQEQIELLPGDEDIASYRRRGYYIAKKILPDELLDDALAGAERFYAGERDHEPPAGSAPGWKPADGAHVLRKNDFVSFQLDEFAALVHYPLLAAVASRLLGEPVRLWHDQLLYKPPDDR